MRDIKSRDRHHLFHYCKARISGVCPYFFFLIVLLAAPASADIFYFKDGGEVEGIAQEETEDHIVIDMGFGTMSVRKSDIDRVVKATPEQLERLKKSKFEHEVESGEWAPSDHEDIRTLYRQAKDDRSKLKEARRKSRAMKADLDQEEALTSKLLDELDEKGRELKKLDPEKDVTEYNVIVADMNTLNAKINKNGKSIKALREKEKKAKEGLSKLTIAYRSDYRLFTDTVSKRQATLDKSIAGEDELYFFEEMDTKVGEMEQDFKKDVSEYSPEGSHVIVPALIDDNVLAQLLVDTGASIVLVSRDVADRLGVRYEDIQAEIDIVMADGSSAEAKPIIFKSLKVGNAEVKNVQAAILDSGTVGGADGLLGMSFLSHFTVSFDGAANKLILESIR